MVGNSVSRVTVRILYFFQVMCFLLVRVQGQAKVFEWLVLLLALLNVTVVVTLLWACYYFAEYMFDFGNMIGLIVDVTQIVAPIFAHFFVLAEAIYFREPIRRLWRDIFAILAHAEVDLDTHLVASYKQFLAKAVTLQVVATFIESRILWAITAAWFNSRMSAEWSFISCRSAYIFYVLHVDIVRGILWAMANDLRYVSFASKSQLKSKRVEMDRRVLLRKLEHNRLLYGQVYSVVLKLNQCLGWSLIGNLMNNFLAITIAFYWNYRGAYIRALTTESLLCSIPLVMGLLVVMYSCEEALKPLLTIKYHLHRIERDKQNLYLHRAIVNYSTQMLQQPICFSTRGFFNINFDLLKGMFGSISLYLVILVQFMPRDQE